MSDKGSMLSGLRPATRALGVKIAIVILAGFVLIVPLQLVRDVIVERAGRAQEVTKEIAGKWGGPQSLQGPFLLLPAERPNANNPVMAPNRRTLVLLPDEYTATAETTTEVRSRGIFDAEIFRATVRLSGSFREDSLNSALLDDGWQLRPDLAVLVLGLGDPRGLQDDLAFRWDSRQVAAEAGVPAGVPSIDGVQWPVQAFAGKGKSSFEITMTLRGSGALSLLPVGRQNSLRIAGNWSSPSFDGSTLPQTQRVDDAGFSADWHISYLSRGLPQSWISLQAPGKEWQAGAVGVKFLDPIDFYRLSERSVKYGMLFIALTFLVLFLFEVLLRLAIHPVQYLLVGAALVLFFLTLVAFAEVIGFAAAYALSAMIVAGMISLYTAAVLRRYRWGGLLFAVTAALYGLLFLILRLEEAALLAGTVVLLVALALTMFATRRIDWYAPGAPAPKPAPGGGESADSPL